MAAPGTAPPADPFQRILNTPDDQLIRQYNLTPIVKTAGAPSAVPSAAPTTAPPTTLPVPVLPDASSPTAAGAADPFQRILSTPDDQLKKQFNLTPVPSPPADHASASLSQGSLAWKNQFLTDAKRFGVVPTSFDTGKHVPTSYHYKGQALDFGGPPDKMLAFAKYIRDTYGKNPELKELFHDPLGGWKNGQSIGAIGGHSNHVHVAWGPQTVPYTADVDQHGPSSLYLGPNTGRPKAPSASPHPAAQNPELTAALQEVSDLKAAADLLNAQLRDPRYTPADKAGIYAQLHNAPPGPPDPNSVNGKYLAALDRVKTLRQHAAVSRATPSVAAAVPYAEPPPQRVIVAPLPQKSTVVDPSRYFTNRGASVPLVYPTQPGEAHDYPDARLNVLIGPNTYDAINWRTPRPARLGERVTGLLAANAHPFGEDPRQAVVQKTLSGEIPALRLSQDPHIRAAQTEELGQLQPYVEAYRAGLFSRVRMSRLADAGNAQGGAGIVAPEHYNLGGQAAANGVTALNPKGLLDYLKAHGVKVTPLQQAALPAIAGAQREAFQSNLTQDERAVASVALHLVAGGVGKLAEVGAHAVAPFLPEGVRAAGEAISDKLSQTAGGRAVAKTLNPAAVGGRFLGGGTFQAIPALAQGASPAVAGKEFLKGGTAGVGIGTGLEGAVEAYRVPGEIRADRAHAGAQQEATGRPGEIAARRPTAQQRRPAPPDLYQIDAAQAKFKGTPRPTPQSVPSAAVPTHVTLNAHPELGPLPVLEANGPRFVVQAPNGTRLNVGAAEVQPLGGAGTEVATPQTAPPEAAPVAAPPPAPEAPPVLGVEGGKGRGWQVTVGNGPEARVYAVPWKQAQTEVDATRIALSQHAAAVHPAAPEAPPVSSAPHPSPAATPAAAEAPAATPAAASASVPAPALDPATLAQIKAALKGRMPGSVARERGMSPDEFAPYLAASVNPEQLRIAAEGIATRSQEQSPALNAYLELKDKNVPEAEADQVGDAAAYLHAHAPHLLPAAETAHAIPTPEAPPVATGPEPHAAGTGAEPAVTPAGPTEPGSSAGTTAGREPAGEPGGGVRPGGAVARPGEAAGSRGASAGFGQWLVHHVARPGEAAEPGGASAGASVAPGMAEAANTGSAGGHEAGIPGGAAHAGEKSGPAGDVTQTVGHADGSVTVPGFHYQQEHVEELAQLDHASLEDGPQAINELKAKLGAPHYEWLSRHYTWLNETGQLEPLLEAHHEWVAEQEAALRAPMQALTEADAAAEREKLRQFWAKGSPEAVSAAGENSGFHYVGEYYHTTQELEAAYNAFPARYRDSDTVPSLNRPDTPAAFRGKTLRELVVGSAVLPPEVGSELALLEGAAKGRAARAATHAAGDFTTRLAAKGDLGGGKYTIQVHDPQPPAGMDTNTNYTVTAKTQGEAEGAAARMHRVLREDAERKAGAATAPASGTPGPANEAAPEAPATPKPEEVTAGEKPAPPSEPEKPPSSFEEAQRWLDDMEAKWDQYGKSLKGRITAGVDPEQLAYWIGKGSIKIGRGVVDAAEWAKQMVDEHGDGIKDHLKYIWEGAKAHYRSVVAPGMGESAPQLADEPQGRSQSAREPRETPPAYPEARTTGLANQVQEREVQRGALGRAPEKGVPRTKQEWQALGEAFLEAHPDYDYETLAKQIAAGRKFDADSVGTGGITAQDMAVLEAGNARLLKAIDAAKQDLDKGRNNSSAEVPKLREAYEAALDRRQAFLDNVQKGKTEWHDIGMVLQSGTHIDYGNYAEVLGEARRVALRKISERDEGFLQGVIGGKGSKDYAEVPTGTEKRPVSGKMPDGTPWESTLYGMLDAAETSRKAEAQRADVAEAHAAQAIATAQAAARQRARGGGEAKGNAGSDAARAPAARQAAIRQTRAALLTDLQALGAKVKAQAQQVNLTAGGIAGPTEAAYTAVREGVPLAGKIAWTYVEEAAANLERVNLDDVVAKVQQHFKEHGIGITRQDIVKDMDEIQSKPTRKQVESDRAKIARAVATEKRLADETAGYNKGVAPEAKARPDAERSAAMQQLLDERDAAKKAFRDAQGASDAAAQARWQKETDRLEAQISTLRRGELPEKTARATPVVPAEVQAMRAEVARLTRELQKPGRDAVALAKEMARVQAKIDIYERGEKPDRATPTPRVRPPELQDLYDRQAELAKAKRDTEQLAARRAKAQSDLEMLARGERPAKAPARMSAPVDPETQALLARRDAALRDFDSRAGLQKQLAELDRRLRENDLAPPAPKGRAAPSPAVADLQNEIRLRQREINSRLAAVKVHPISRFAMALQMADLLSSPVLHSVKFGSLAAHAATQPLARAIEASIHSDTYFPEISRGAIGYFGAMPEALKAWQETIRTGVSGVEARRLELPNSQYGGKPNPFNLPTRDLAGIRTFYYTMAKRGELAAQAAKIASRELKAGTLPKSGFEARFRELSGDPTPEMIEAADRQADYMTMHGEGEDAIIKGMNEIRKLPLMHIAVPFFRAPYEISKAGIGMTPLSPLAWALRGDLDGAAKARLTSRALLGTAVMAMAAPLVASGYLTGAMPTDPKERAEFIAAHKIPYGAYLPGLGRYVSYKHLGALGVPLGATAAAVDEWKHTGKEPDSERLAKAAVMFMKGVGEGAAQASWFNGVSHLLEYVKSESAAGTKLAPEIARYVDQWLVRSFLPASGALGLATDITDPMRRKAETLGETVRANLPNIPGLPAGSKALPATYPREPSGMRAAMPFTHFGPKAEVPKPLETTSPRPPRPHRHRVQMAP